MKLTLLPLFLAASALAQPLGTNFPSNLQLRFTLANGNTMFLEAAVTGLRIETNSTVKSPPTFPPLPPEPFSSRSAKSAPPAMAFSTNPLPGFPKFEVLHKPRPLGFAPPPPPLVSTNVLPLMSTNVFYYTNTDFGQTSRIFSADAFGFRAEHFYQIDVAKNLWEWRVYKSRFMWSDSDPEAYLRWQVQMLEPKCVPPAPNGVTDCPVAKRFWRLLEVP